MNAMHSRRLRPRHEEVVEGSQGAGAVRQLPPAGSALTPIFPRPVLANDGCQPALYQWGRFSTVERRGVPHCRH